jgi:hypothetical protein
MNKITYLDGARLHRAMVAGINNVLSRQDYLNKINVFPVPDGDTGTNMAFTLNSILDSTAKKVPLRVDDMLAQIADAALDGARGNSGVILAQFFQGLSDGAIGVKKMTPESFAKAVKFGAEYARDALAEPQEGTILTVLTDFSNRLIELIESNKSDFEHLIEMGINEAEKSLENTPNLLAVLKKAGVVDAGAQGFVDFLRGIFNFIKCGDIKGFKTDTNSSQLSVEIERDDFSFENSEFRYCTECIIIGEKIIHKDLRESLLTTGNSLVIAGSKKKAKVHIHVNEPKEVFKICSDFGVISGEKADDMWQQQKTAQGYKTKGVAIVTDSGADIPDDIDLNIHVVPVRYNFGNVGYIDKVSQTSEEFFNELATNPNHPQTSQPTPGDFRRQYQYLKSHYDSILSIHLPHELSGTYQSALNAAKRVDNENIKVIDGYSASVGLGLIVIKAATLAKEGKSFDEINALLPKIISSSKVYLAIKDLKFVVRGGRLPTWVKSVADILHIRPILSTKENGTLGAAGVLLGTDNLPKKLCKFVLAKMDKNTFYTVIVGHSNTLEDGKILMELIKKGHNKIENIYLIDMGCALGVHAGPGSLVAGIQSIS